MLGGGIALLVASVVSWVLAREFPLSVAAAAVFGAALVIVGIVILSTEFLEAALSRGQTALVDGLQAG